MLKIHFRSLEYSFHTSILIVFDIDYILQYLPMNKRVVNKHNS